MKGPSRTMLGLAVFYTAVVAIADFFLVNIPVINWLVLGFAFMFFTALIIESVVGLLAESGATREKVFDRHEDELERLAKIVEKALIQEDSESVTVLEKRLRGLEKVALSRRATRFGSKSHNSQSLSTAAGDDLSLQMPADSPSVLQNPSSKEIEDLLSRIEAWLT